MCFLRKTVDCILDSVQQTVYTAHSDLDVFCKKESKHAKPIYHNWTNTGYIALHTGGLAVGGFKELKAVKVEFGFESQLWLKSHF